MSSNVSTMLTKDLNETSGRKGYAFFKREKVTSIGPNKYGDFLNRKKKEETKSGIEKVNKEDCMDELFRPIDILNSSAREVYDGIGHIFTINDFLADVRMGCITDYDGFGELMIDNYILSDTVIDLYSESVSVSFFGSIDFTMLSMIYGDRVKICWYNN